jgi:hypothetical protein
VSVTRITTRRAAWLAAALLAAPLAWAVPFWGDKESQPADTDPALLKPGQFIWEGDAAPGGPVTVAVSLEEQRAYVYRNGIRVGITTASTGKAGHRTPTGVFTVLQKDKDHHSKTYGNAPMPYTERLTWDGVALHAGGLPGYPSSHGCVHLPSEFARRLFEISPMGMVVVIADEHAGPAHVRHPTAVAPVDAASGAEVDTPRLGALEDYRWTPESAPADGPLSILVSGADQRVLVFRDGVEIGRARIHLRDPEAPLGTHAYVRLDETARAPAALAGGATPRWIAIGLPGHEADKGLALDHQSAERIAMPPQFAAKLRAVLKPGDTLVVTDGAVFEHTTGASMTLVTTNPPPAAAPKPDGEI